MPRGDEAPTGGSSRQWFAGEIPPAEFPVRWLAAESPRPASAPQTERRDTASALATGRVDPRAATAQPGSRQPWQPAPAPAERTYDRYYPPRNTGCRTL